MKVAKIIALISFLLHGLWAVLYLVIFLKIRVIFQELEAQTPFPWLILLPAIFAIGSLFYWLYLKKRERVPFALWLSIALLIIPFIIYSYITLISLFQPLYNLSY